MLRDFDVFVYTTPRISDALLYDTWTNKFSCTSVHGSYDFPGNYVKEIITIDYLTQNFYG